MASADEYRAKATDLDDKARRQTDPGLKAELEAMALGYRRLSEHAERKARTRATSEAAQQPNAQQQQQQQIQPGKKGE